MQYRYIVGLSAVLATTVFSQTTNWDAKLKEVSSYDNYTERLTYGDGTWKKPKKDVLKALGAMKSTVQDVARRMGVDPRAVAGAILAENSLNVSVSDGVQDFLVKHGMAKGGSVMGKKFTFGWGQLYMEAARQGERVAAKLENRKEISDKELQDALLVPEKAVYYVAAVIRKVQDDYKAQGIDISGNPAVLATLYNLGKSEIKAKEAKASGRTPRENFFGLFVDRYLGDIEGAVGKPPAPVPVAKPGPVVVAAAKPAPKAQPKPAPKVAPKTASAPVAKKERPKKFQTVLTGDLPVYQAPPTCQDSHNEMSGLIQRYKSYSYSKVTSVMKATEAVKTVVPAIDCEANPWVLIRSGDQMGWVSQKDFDAKSEKRLAEVDECKSKSDPKCKAAVQESTKEFWADEKSDPKASVLYLSPIASTGKGNFKQMDERCSAPKQQANPVAVQQASSWMSSQYYFLNLQSMKEDPKEQLANIDAVEKALNDKLNEIDQKFKLNGDFNSASNPYQIISAFTTIKDQVKNCRTQVQNGLPCPVRMDQLVEPIKSVEVKEEPSYAELQNAESNLMGNMCFGCSSSKVFAVTKEEFKTKDQIISGMDNCIARLDAFAQTFAAKSSATANTSCPTCGTSASTSGSASPTPTSTPAMGYTGMGGRNLQFNIGNIKSVMDSVKSGSEEDVQKLIPTLSRYEKACHAFVDLVQEAPATTASAKTSSNSCESFPLANNMGGMMKSINGTLARKMIMGDENLASATLSQIMESIIPSYVVNNNSGMGMYVNQDMQGAYCPNKTAEFIEELLKNNKCIKMVHMPSRWIVNRLNDYSDKMIFRPFEEEDRYGIEFVGGCAK